MGGKDKFEGIVSSYVVRVIDWECETWVIGEM